MSAQPSSSSSKQEPVSDADRDIEKLLNREASAFQREVEVERILKAFKLKCVLVLALSLMGFELRWLTWLSSSPYDILDISELATQEEIKKRYRQLSLCASYTYFFLTATD